MFQIFKTPARTLAMIALSCAAGAAQAQERGACGQPLALTQGSYFLKGGEAPIDLLVSIARREPAYIEFEVIEPTGLTIETSTQSVDPVVIVFDQNGLPVRGDDDGFGDLNARLGMEYAPGRYCAQISTLTEVPAGGPVPAGFDTAIPVQIRAGIEPGSGGCFTNPGLVHLDEPFGMNFAQVDLDGIAPMSYAFTVEEGTQLSIFARSNDVDTLLLLEDANGQEIASDDDGGGGTNSYVGLGNGLAAGDYCVAINSYDGSPGQASLSIAEYSADAADQLSSGAPANPCGDSSNTRIAEVALGAGETILNTSGLLTDTSQDLRFELSEPMSLRLTALSNDFDTVLWLYDANGALINESDDGEGLGTNSRIQSATVLPAGAYCASVGPYGGSGSGGYSLDVIELSEEALLAEAYAAGELLPGAGSGIEMVDLGLLHRSLRTDNAGGETRWYLFEVEDESFVVIDSASVGAVSRIALFDYEGTGQQIAASQLDDAGVNTRLVRKVGSGIYALAVVPDTLDGGGLGASALSLQRYIRPPRQ